jgi:N-acetylglucosamine-6-sulfatase
VALRLAVLAALAVTAAGCGGSGGEPASGKSGPPLSERPQSDGPNIILIRTDDQTLDQLSRRTMPNTMRLLASGGTSFTDFIVTTPLCCPSRATTLTGQYGHNNGVLKDVYKFLRDKSNILPAWLQRAGYVTAHVGKYLNQFENVLPEPADVPAGWDRWVTQLEPQGYYGYDLSENGRTVHFGQAPSDYVTRVLDGEAVRLVRRWTPGPRPLFLQLDQFAPHTSPRSPIARCKGAAVPDPRDQDRFRGAPIPTRRPNGEQNISDKPPFMRSLPGISDFHFVRLERHYGCALASLREVDRGVAQIVTALRRTGALDRTAILFTSDNGYYYGEHRIPKEKEFAYEEGIHLPLIVWLGRKLRDGPQPADVSVPTANIDIAPTLLDLAGAKPCNPDQGCRVMDGRSLVPLLEGRAGGWPPGRPLLVELDAKSSGGYNHQLFSRVCRYVGVRAGSEMLIRSLTVAEPGSGCRRDVEEELYDLRHDPRELHNLLPARPGSPAAAERRRLAALLSKLRDCSGLRGRDPRPPSGHYCG